MQVLIFEPDSEGHRLHYVRNMIIALRMFLNPSGITIALASDAPASPNFKVHLADLASEARFDAWMTPPPKNVAKGAAHRVGMLRESIRRAKPQWLYVPYADGLGQILGLRRSLGLPTLPRGLHAEGLMLRGGFAYPHASLKEHIALSLSWAAARRAPWEVMHVLDPIVHQRAPRSRLMPDPVELPERCDRAASRGALKLPLDGRIVSCVGIIDGRKGVPLLLRAFVEADLDPRDRLLLAGPHRPEIRELLNNEYSSFVQQGRIISIDRTLPVSDLLEALVASDLVCAVYPRHIGSASIAIRAAAAGRPTLGQNFGWLGHVVPEFDLGWTCEVTDPSALKDALGQALRRSGKFKITEKARRFVEFHRIENFQAHWTAHLRRHLGLPPQADMKSWDWVLAGSS